MLKLHIVAMGIEKLFRDYVLGCVHRFLCRCGRYLQQHSIHFDGRNRSWDDVVFVW